MSILLSPWVSAVPSTKARLYTYHDLLLQQSRVRFDIELFRKIIVLNLKDGSFAENIK